MTILPIVPMYVSIVYIKSTFYSDISFDIPNSNNVPICQNLLYTNNVGLFRIYTKKSKQ